MDSTFDPYRAWLGIPPGEQPPHHYRLLGLPLFESDGEFIEAAVRRQVSSLRRHVSGPHRTEAERLLAEISRARVGLLVPEKKAAYDAALRRQIEPEDGGGDVYRLAHAEPPPLPTAPRPRRRKSAAPPLPSRKPSVSRRFWLSLAASAAATLLVAGITTWLLWRGTSAEDEPPALAAASANRPRSETARRRASLPPVEQPADASPMASPPELPMEIPPDPVPPAEPDEAGFVEGPPHGLRLDARPPARHLLTASAAPLAVAVSADGRWAAALDRDGTLRVWDVASRQERQRVEAVPDPGPPLQFTADGQAVFYRSGLRLLRRDINGGQEVEALALPPRREGEPSPSFDPMALSADGRRALFVKSAAEGPPSVVLWDLEQRREVRNWPAPPAGLTGAALSPDGRLAALTVSPAADAEMPAPFHLRVWDVETGNDLIRAEADGGAGFATARFSPDGNLLYTLGPRGDEVRVWDVTTAEQTARYVAGSGESDTIGWLQPLPQPSLALAVRLSGERSALALLDVAAGQDLFWFAGLDSDVTTLALSADGCIALTGTDAGRLVLWDFSPWFR